MLPWQERRELLKTARNTEDYTKVEVEKVEPADDELFVPKGGIGRCVREAAEMLLGEKPKDFIKLIGSGPAISKVVQLANLLRHKIPGLHMVTSLYTKSRTDVYEPLHDDLDEITIEMNFVTMEIQLSYSEIDDGLLGYQKPLPKDEVEEATLEELSTVPERTRRRSGSRNRNRNNSRNRRGDRDGRGDRGGRRDGNDERQRRSGRNQRRRRRKRSYSDSESEERKPRRTR